MKKNNYIGKIFDHFTVLERVGNTKKYICRCACGTIKQRYIQDLKKRHYSSCGCINSRRKEIQEGKRLGFWTIGIYDHLKGQYFCTCVCGTQKYVRTHNLKNGSSKSCGCKTIILRNKTKDIRADIIGVTTKIKSLYKIYKNNAEKNDREFCITIEQFSELIKQNCGYCNRKPYSCVAWGKSKKDKINSKHKLLYNGIDRIDNNLGYSLPNIITCCKVCNYAKRNMPHEEWISWLEDIRDYDYPTKVKAR